MRDDEVMNEAPPDEVDLGSTVPVLPDRAETMKVIRRTHLQGNRQRVELHMKVGITKTLKRDSYYDRIKTAWTVFLGNRDMELSIVTKDGSKIHSIADFPKTLREFNDIVDLKQDDDRQYQAYIMVDTKYMPNEIIRKDAEAKSVVSPSS